MAQETVECASALHVVRDAPRRPGPWWMSSTPPLAPTPTPLARPEKAAGAQPPTPTPPPRTRWRTAAKQAAATRNNLAPARARGRDNTTPATTQHHTWWTAKHRVKSHTHFSVLRCITFVKATFC